MRCVLCWRWVSEVDDARLTFPHETDICVCAHCWRDDEEEAKA